MIRVGIIGGAGYTGGETLRLLLNHPGCEVVFIHSKSNAGRKVYDVHADLLGETDMTFSDSFDTPVDVIFLCLGHGDSRKFLQNNPIMPTIRIIDLSQDFRLAASSVEGGRKFVYGLSDKNFRDIAQADNIANPGCFATCIQQGLLPLAGKHLLNDEVNVTATTGSTGAGQKPTTTTHFSWRESNLSVYKPFDHQHLHEIGETLAGLNGSTPVINFVPYRGDFTRGIIATIQTKCKLSLDEIKDIYKDYYTGSPFTFISDSEISLKQVVNTNKCIIKLDKHGDVLLITSIIDNLLRGASGQAVENMNIMFGLKRDTGLRLKASAF